MRGGEGTRDNPLVPSKKERFLVTIAVVPARELGQPVPPPTEDARLIEADLFAEATIVGEGDAIDLRRGVKLYLLPGQSVYLTTSDELRLLYRSVESKKADDHANAMISLGHYAGADGTE